ncbi:hypothetical protein [Desulfatibacillum aliphaticivorans]|uniref:hypothetical protein n=1 Tax=Desulfatibacillum aliphaticivorans TaxID=218208 RepID=UPI0002F80337|nr:hypothetical protein [Desulfatibacillum aliphaticivorans]
MGWLCVQAGENYLGWVMADYVSFVEDLPKGKKPDSSRFYHAKLNQPLNPGG